MYHDDGYGYGSSGRFGERLTKILIAVIVLVAIGLLASIFDVFSFSTTAFSEIDDGTYANHEYQNEYFGMKIEVPAEWRVLDKGTIEEIVDEGAQLLTGDSKAKVSTKQSRHLLVATERPIIYSARTAPVFECVVSRIPGCYTPEDYLSAMRKQFEGSQIDVSFPGEIGTKSIGGKEFKSLHLVIENGALQQKWFTCMIKGYALGFAITYTRPTQEGEMQEMLSRVRFSQ
ncbi:MAG: hypothetical protein AAF802_10540 [Planctomycetota bacterium]